MSNHLAEAFPAIGRRLPTYRIGNFPTPVSVASLQVCGRERRIGIKHDDLTAEHYGGNKVRKLEYLIARANERGAERIATFGAVGSNHAVATALYTRQAGMGCTCFLSHQSLKPGLGRALRFHQQHQTEILRYGGKRSERVNTLRKSLWGRNAWVVPLGGTCWLGIVGFVNAALELVAQIEAGEIAEPKRVYVPLGTMGTAAGLALGFALAGRDIDVQGIRVTDEQVANAPATQRLISKTAMLLSALDQDVPADIAQHARITVRNEFFGEGYGRTNEATEQAIRQADKELGVKLESTYSGKAMAALIHDLAAGLNEPALFWNTYNSRPLDVDETLAPDFSVMPREFARYFD